MKKLNFKSNLCAFMAGVLVTAAVPVLAYTGTQTIEATFKNIRVVVDGKEITPKDAAGNVLEPFIYNGSTYLPIRAVGEAVGKDVSFDGETNTVYLGSSESSGSTTSSNLGRIEPYQSSCMNEGTFKIGGVGYDNSIGFTTDGYAYYNLDGKYTSISGIYGLEDGTSEGVVHTIDFYGDGKLLGTLSPKSGKLAESFSIDLTGVTQLVIRTESGILKHTILGNVEIK